MAEYINQYGFYIGCHHGIGKTELDYVIDKIGTYIEKFYHRRHYMKKIALITGITGQDGSYLSEFLLEKEYEVHGLVRRTSIDYKERIVHLENNPCFYLHYGDLSDSISLLKIIGQVQPDEIYNLAAQSHVQVSFEVPEYTADVVALGILRILEAVRICGLEKKCRIYQASTSELYGKVEEVPQKETTPFHPYSPYAVANNMDTGLLKSIGKHMVCFVVLVFYLTMSPKGVEKHL